MEFKENVGSPLSSIDEKLLWLRYTFLLALTLEKVFIPMKTKHAIKI